MPVSSVTEHWIKQDAIIINLNHFGDPDYLQVSVLAGAVVMAFKQDVIGYNAARNYRTWPLQAANTFFETTDALNVYARLTRSEVNASALIIYDQVLRDIEGRSISYADDGSEILGEADAEYYYIYLGQISSSIDTDGNEVDRHWSVDFRFGNLDTNQYRNEEAGGEWTKMFRLNKVTDMIDVLKTFSSAFFKKIFIGNKGVTDIKRSYDTDKDVPVSDESLTTSKYVNDKFLNKDKDDRSKGKIASDKGFEVGEYTEGVLGSGAAMYMDEHGSSHIVGDYLDVRKKATFTTISVQELKHVGGEVILSPAAMVCSKVEETVTGWKCYFNTTDGERQIYNEFEVGDFARCQTFNLEKSKYYWRKVEEKGTDYIVLSKSYCDPLVVNDVPEVGDNISQCGNDNDDTRQSAIILSAYGEDAPSYKQYKGIDRFALSPDMLVTKLSPKGNVIKGNFVSESTGKSINDDIEDIKVDWNKVLQQTDKEFTMWFFDYVPMMDNMPAVEWTSDELKLLHEQDLFFVTSDDLATSGRAYRFELRDGEWGWYEVTDADTIKALENAHTAQQSADSKMRNFVAQPIPPYDKGDRWCNATYGELYDNDDLVCITPKAEGEVFDIGDWQPTSMAKSATIKSFVKFTFDENGNKVFESGILLEADEINFKGKVLIDGNFSVDEEGNITLNNLTANNGIFNGEVNATSGIFNNVTIESGNIAGFDISKQTFGIDEYGVLTSDGKSCIIFNYSDDKFLRINDPTEEGLIVARNNYGVAARFTSSGTLSEALQLVAEGGGFALNATGKSELKAPYSDGSNIKISGLALNCKTTELDANYPNNNFYNGAWVDFLVCNGDVTLPSAFNNKGKVLFVKTNGSVSCAATDNGIVLADGTNAQFSIDRGKKAMMYISNGYYWYEFYCG